MLNRSPCGNNISDSIQIQITLRTSLTTVSEFHYAELLPTPTNPTHLCIFSFITLSFYYIFICSLKKFFGKFKQNLNCLWWMSLCFQRCKFWYVRNSVCRTGVKAVSVPWGNSQMLLSSPGHIKGTPWHLDVSWSLSWPTRIKQCFPVQIEL